MKENEIFKGLLINFPPSVFDVVTSVRYRWNCNNLENKIIDFCLLYSNFRI